MSPEAILKVGNVVVVSSRGSTFYVFDPDSAHELRRFNITTVARELGEKRGERQLIVV